MRAGIKIFAPASVANLACGYDILGLALEQPGDEIIARPSDQPGIRISRIFGAQGKLPTDIRVNTAGVAATQVLEAAKEPKFGIDLEIHKKMPFGTGMGSSACSAVAGAMAVNELLGRPFEKRELLPFAVAGEEAADGAWHADNIAPSLLGGVILVRNNMELDVIRLHSPPGLRVTIILPEIQVLTKDSRAILSPEVPLADHIQQSANLGGLVAGLFNSDLELIRRSLKDRIIEPQRAKLIPHFYDVQDAALSEGALGCSISGAGPAIFAISANTLVAERVGEAMERAFNDRGIGTRTYQSGINLEGSIKC